MYSCESHIFEKEGSHLVAEVKPGGTAKTLAFLGNWIDYLTAGNIKLWHLVLQISTQIFTYRQYLEHRHTPVPLT